MHQRGQNENPRRGATGLKVGEQRDYFRPSSHALLWRASDFVIASELNFCALLNWIANSRARSSADNRLECQFDLTLSHTVSLAGE